MIEPTSAHIVRSGAMGDVLYAEPLIRAIADQNYEDTFFYCDTPYAQLFDNHPILKEVRVSECENNGNPQIPYRCHLMYNLNWVYENAWFHGDTSYITDIYLKHFNLPQPHPPHPQLYLDRNEKKPPESFPKNRKILAVNAISRWEFKEWPAILEYAKKLGFFIVGFGQDRKRRLNLSFDLDLRNKTTFRQMLSLVYASDAVLTLESGPLPIADALGKKGIALIFESEPQSILRSNTQLKWISCHDLPFDFLKIRETVLKQKHLHLKINEIKAELDNLIEN